MHIYSVAARLTSFLCRPISSFVSRLPHLMQYEKMSIAFDYFSSLPMNMRLSCFSSSIIMYSFLTPMSSPVNASTR